MTLVSSVFLIQFKLFFLADTQFWIGFKNVSDLYSFYANFTDVMQCNYTINSFFWTQKLRNSNLAIKLYSRNCDLCFVHPIFGFSFLVTFGDQVTKIWKYYVIFVYILQSKMGKTEKNEEKITQLKWPKYQKPKDQNMGCTK